MLKSNQNIISNKTPPGLLLVWTAPVDSASRGVCLIGGGGVKTLPFYLRTAYNVSSMEDSEISWLLCWQWKHAAQNYIHLCFKSFELWHLCKSLLPSAKGLSVYFYCWVIILL
jgi:hypothetical protein